MATLRVDGFEIADRMFERMGRTMIRQIVESYRSSYN